MEPCSDVASIGGSRFDALCLDEENAAKETPVEDAEARDDAGEERNRIVSAESSISADIRENPNTLQTHEPESLRAKKQEAIKLGIYLSTLVGEAMQLSSNTVLNCSSRSLQRFLKIVNGPLDVNGIVVYYLNDVYKSLKLHIPFDRLTVNFEQSQFDEFLKLFSDAISLLEEVIRGVRILCRTKILEEEPEKLSALNSAIQDCRRQLMKIDVEITTVKQHCYKGLGTVEQIRSLRWIPYPEVTFAGWNNLFDSEVVRETHGGPEADDEDTASQPSIQ